MEPEEVRRRIIQAKLHLEFCIELYEYQVKRGLHFLHEHPASATSWADDRVQELIQKLGIEPVIGHMCQYGMVHVDKSGKEWPVLKPTRWLSSSPALLRRLGRKCPPGCGS